MKSVLHRFLPTPRSSSWTVLVLLTLAGCAKSTPITTNAAGHAIHAQVEGNHSIETQPDQGVIGSRFGKVTIERGRVQLEGAPGAKISEGVPVNVSISKHKMRVTAGSVTIARTSS